MAAEPEQAEEEFGPYLVYERLGVGGMATVHRALERGIEGFERMVALKRLLPHLAEDASFIKSFVREAKLASLLNHVNIVQIYELGRVGTEYFISMEYIDGKDIRRILRHARKVTGPPPIHITVGMLLQLCDALDYAHNRTDEEGQPMMLVHRDVSPSNLLVTSAGHVKVIDFGIAKAQSSQLRTQTGRVKGKLAYMAPEAITGKELDARSDLFAVGVIAHELLTARPLFASKNEYQTLLKVQRGDIMPPSTFNQACPAELDAIVLRALARTPDERYGSASELRDELVALRRQYALQTSYRDIAQWVDWAFSVEAPAHNFSGSFTIDNTGGSGVVASGRAKQKDEEEAVEIAWGGGKEQEEEDGGPVVLDDVPDYSQPSYLSPSQSARVKDEEIHVEIDDDIPTPAPRAASRELPTQEPTALSFPPVRKRSQTEPGHTPAPPSSRQSGRMDAQSPSESGRQLADLVLEGAEDTAAEVAAAALGPKPNAMPPMPQGPTVRFKTPTIHPSNRTSTTPPPVLKATPQVPVQIPVNPIRPRATPVPMRAPTPTAPPFAAVSDEPIPAPTPRLRPKTTMNPPLGAPTGAVIAARAPDKPKRTLMMVAGILLAGAAATAVTLVITHGQDTVTSVAEDPQPRVAPRSVGTLKFNTEPADAEITIDGKKVHDGSPWATELEAGAHQVQIEHKDYKGWLTQIELDRAETQTLRVVLEPLGSVSVTAQQEATLTLRTTPAGLEATLDGTVLAVKTPIKMPIKVGPHSIILKQNGIELWRQEVDAKAATNYEFEPNLDAEHTRERTQRAPNASAIAASGRPEATVAREKVAEPEPAPAPPPPPPPPAKIEAKIDEKLAAPEKPATPPPAAKAPEKIATKPLPGEPEPAPAWADEKAAPRPAAKGPVMVPPNAVTKLSGTPPEVGKMKGADLPPVVSAKVCIDADGKVTSADILSKIERHAATDFADAIRTWAYAPYKVSGVPTPACFALSFRVK